MNTIQNTILQHDVLQVSLNSFGPVGASNSDDGRAQGQELLKIWLGTSTYAIAVQAHEEMSILVEADVGASGVRSTQAPLYSRVYLTVPNHFIVPSFLVSKSGCEKEDEDDCKEFCGLVEQTATCSANGNKVTCFCKGGKSESNCEERCLLCMSRATPTGHSPDVSNIYGVIGMPDKSALEEASRLFKLGGSRIEEL